MSDLISPKNALNWAEITLKSCYSFQISNCKKESDYKKIPCTCKYCKIAERVMQGEIEAVYEACYSYDRKTRKFDDFNSSVVVERLRKAAFERFNPVFPS